jgi:hypothetical protein
VRVSHTIPVSARILLQGSVPNLQASLRQDHEKSGAEFPLTTVKFGIDFLKPQHQQNTIGLQERLVDA